MNSTTEKWVSRCLWILWHLLLQFIEEALHWFSAGKHSVYNNSSVRINQSTVRTTSHVSEGNTCNNLGSPLKIPHHAYLQGTLRSHSHWGPGSFLEISFLQEQRSHCGFTEIWEPGENHHGLEPLRLCEKFLLILHSVGCLLFFFSLFWSLCTGSPISNISFKATSFQFLVENTKGKGGWNCKCCQWQCHQRPEHSGTPWYSWETDVCSVLPLGCSRQKSSLFHSKGYGAWKSAWQLVSSIPTSSQNQRRMVAAFFPKEAEWENNS